MSCEHSVIEQITLQCFSKSVFFCGLSHLVSPEEPLVMLALKSLRHQRSKPRTVFARRPQQLEKSKTTAQHQWK